MANLLIAGRDCENCVHADINEKTGIVICNARDKRYFFGQYVPCEDKEKKNETE